MSYQEGLSSDDESVSADSRGILPVSSRLVVEELDSVIKLLSRHMDLYQGIITGVVAVEAGSISETIGELLYTSSKLESLARILNGEGSGS